MDWTMDRRGPEIGVELPTVRKAAAKVEPYVRAHGVKVWSLTQLERQFRFEAFGPRRPERLHRPPTYSHR
jgi:hypothetical protein